MINSLKESFTEMEQKWYIANFYVYLHYHPTNDYPINLENVYKLLGFTTKGNAKRVLENNFTAGEDYKSSFIPSDKREILETFATKKLLAKILNIDQNTLKRLIEKQTPFNNNYYILLNDCSPELLNKYNKKIDTYYVKGSIKIKQINPISKQEVIFNSLSDASKQYGINIKTLTKCINNKTIYAGSLWEYDN
jgi:hypothetical protein